MGGFGRRGLVKAAAAAPVAAAVEADAAPEKLNFTTSADHVRAFIKLNASLDSTTVFHTYTGTLEAVSGH